jgi:hypothetical protein
VQVTGNFLKRSAAPPLTESDRRVEPSQKRQRTATAATPRKAGPQATADLGARGSSLTKTATHRTSAPGALIAGRHSDQGRAGGSLGAAGFPFQQPALLSSEQPRREKENNFAYNRISVPADFVFKGREELLTIPRGLLAPHQLEIAERLDKEEKGRIRESGSARASMRERSVYENPATIFYYYFLKLTRNSTHF